MNARIQFNTQNILDLTTGILVVDLFCEKTRLSCGASTSLYVLATHIYYSVRCSQNFKSLRDHDVVVCIKNYFRARKVFRSFCGNKRLQAHFLGLRCCLAGDRGSAQAKKKHF